MIVERTCKTCGCIYKTQKWRNKFYCSTKCYKKTGANNPKWGGGTVIVGGYRYIYNPTHPNCTQNGYVVEHRLVMEQSIKRYLRKKEVVHHINHNRLDNRIENLILFSSNGEHTRLEHIKRDKKTGRFT